MNTTLAFKFKMLAFAMLFTIIETVYFGMNWTPQSQAESYADSFGLFLFFLSFLTVRMCIITGLGFILMPFFWIGFNVAGCRITLFELYMSLNTYLKNKWSMGLVDQ